MTSLTNIYVFGIHYIATFCFLMSFEDVHEADRLFIAGGL